MKIKPNQIVACTYFDTNYLVKGLAMIRSFRKFNPQLPIAVLCLDEYTKEALEKLKISNLVTIKLEEFIDTKLKKARNNRSKVEFYWTCSPHLPLYIFDKYQASSVVYLDADLYFFSSIKSAIEESKGKSVLVVEHRYPKAQAGRQKTTGRFNVGFEIYNRTNETISCLKRWRDQCLEWCYYRVEDGKMGDQGYLNEWPERYPNLVISQNIGLNAAPWNISQYKVTKKDSKVFINNDELICYHFHQLIFNSRSDFLFATGYNFSEQTIKYIYSPYLNSLEKSFNELKSIDPSFEINPTTLSLSEKLKSMFIKNFGNLYWQLQTIIQQ